MLGRHADVTEQPPKLVVVLTIDQMRSDYVDRYSHQWTGGLKRLVTDGARFMKAAYPYLNTVTCPGHATISTGTFPRTHGQILNAWWRREQDKTVDCLTDDTVTALPYNLPDAVSRGFGPGDLQSPAFADELRAQSAHVPTVLSVAVKPRSAIALAGARADMVLWIDGGGLTTSTAYTPTRTPFVSEFVKRHPLDVELARDWTPILRPEQYLYADADQAERPLDGWTTTFPHAIASNPNDARRAALWAASPLVDEYLGRVVEEAIGAYRLGRRGGTDVLAMSFSTLDSVGHAFGPNSHEVQDALARIDAVIGGLLRVLDRDVGVGNYVIALSADHGVSPIPEQASRDGLQAGRVDAARVVATLEAALARRWGAGSYVRGMSYTDLYLAPGMATRLNADPHAWADVEAALRSVPGIDKAFGPSELASRVATHDPALHAARLSYFPGRSGDIVLVPRPYWILSSAAATHGTLYAYDARVPVILYGAGIRSGRYWNDATPADIAPTLAALTGVTMARAEGRVLAEALVDGEPAPQPGASR